MATKDDFVKNSKGVMVRRGSADDDSKKRRRRKRGDRFSAMAVIKGAAPNVGIGALGVIPTGIASAIASRVKMISEWADTPAKLAWVVTPMSLFITIIVGFVGRKIAPSIFTAPRIGALAAGAGLTSLAVPLLSAADRVEGAADKVLPAPSGRRVARRRRGLATPGGGAFEDARARIRNGGALPPDPGGAFGGTSRQNGIRTGGASLDRNVVDMRRTRSGIWH